MSNVVPSQLLVNGEKMQHFDTSKINYNTFPAPNTAQTLNIQDSDSVNESYFQIRINFQSESDETR